MSSARGFFEGQEEYEDRIRLEAKEAEVESLAGTRPSRGFFEGDKEYEERVTRQAYEERVASLDGARPSQGWFESKPDYDRRLEKTANESVVRSATDSKPGAGFFESEEAYLIRVRKEANEHFIAGVKGEKPTQGFFQGDHDYRSDIAHRARVLRADGKSLAPKGETASVGWTSEDYSSASVPVSAAIPAVETAVPSSGTEGVGRVAVVNCLLVVGAVLVAMALNRRAKEEIQMEPPAVVATDAPAQPPVEVESVPPNPISAEAGALTIESKVGEVAGGESSALPELFLPFPPNEAIEIVGAVWRKTWRLEHSVQSDEPSAGASILESDERVFRRIGKNWKVRFVVGLVADGSETRLVSRVVCRRGEGDEWESETERCAAKFGAKFERKLEAAVEKRVKEARERRPAWDR